MFLDESGVTTEMTRRYGRAARGLRVPDAVPAGHWRTLTLLGALGLRGVRAAMTVEAPTDGDVFLAYVEQVLGPRLEPGEVVVLDNLPAHKVAGVRELIEARGAQLLYLPPYSPTSIPSSQPGPRSKSGCGPSKPAPSRSSTTPSPSPWLPSPRTTLPAGSVTADIGYSNDETALALAETTRSRANSAMLRSTHGRPEIPRAASLSRT